MHLNVRGLEVSLYSPALHFAFFFFFFLVRDREEGGGGVCVSAV